MAAPTRFAFATANRIVFGPGTAAEIPGLAADLGADWKGGFFCPCHGSKFDLAGRVFSGAPAPTNLEVPPYQFLGETTILIGDDGEAA